MVEDEIGALIARARASDKAANATLLAIYRPLLAALIVSWAARLPREAVEHDDLWQEAYRQFFELVRSYRLGSPLAFGVYLKRVLGWRLANYVRAERRRRATFGALTVEHLDLLTEELRTNVGGGWNNPRLRSAFHSLSPRQRGIIVRIYGQDRAVAEVAAALGMTPRELRLACRRAEAKLRRTMVE